MVLAHNLLSMYTDRQLNITSDRKTKSLEKLSSGYRINRASDDAAGLSISEKMRRQIRGLNRGIENTQDGISLCQVADGALAEVTDMLHRITELSVQSANGTNSESDRRAIQAEIGDLLSEIDRVGETTTFNGRKIFSDSCSEQSYMGIIGYKDEIVTNTTNVPMTDNFNFYVTGQSTDSAAAAYTIDTSTSLSNGIVIGTDAVAWDKVTDENGDVIDLSGEVQKGKYSFEYKGMNVSFELKRNVTTDQLVLGLQGMKWSSKQGTGNVMSYSLSATSDNDYSNTLKDYTIQALDDGLYVNNVKYEWPDSIKNGPQNGWTISFKAGNLTVGLSIGADNTASMSEIFANIGTRSFSEESRTGVVSVVNFMSAVNTTINTEYKSENEIKDLLAEQSCIKADSYGMYLQLAGKNLTKISWDDMYKNSKQNGAYNELTYQDGNISITFSVVSGMSYENLAKAMNDTLVKVSYAPIEYKNAISKTPADTYYNGVENYFIDNLTINELDKYLKIKQFSFTKMDDGTAAFIEDPDNTKWSTNAPHIMEEPEKVYGIGIDKSYNGKLLAIGNNGSAVEGYQLVNGDELKEYFLRRNIKNKPESGENSINLIFKNGNSTINLKMIDTMQQDCDLETFIDGITGRASYYNEPFISIVFPVTGNDDALYKYKVDVPSSRGASINYTRYSGIIDSVDKNMSDIIADKVDNIPSYSYIESKETTSVIKTPIYGEVTQNGNNGIWIQSGTDAWSGMWLEIDKMNSEELGIDDLDVSTITGAEKAMNSIDEALKKLSDNRSRVGAQQNRLEHTVLNEQNIVENTQSAESRIRDTDMAEEMVTYSKNNILAQAGQSMLAQANQSTQGVLSLLQ